MAFYPYQQEWLDDDSRFKVGMWSRQTGKTFTSTYEVVRDAILTPRRTWVIMSAGERQAKEAVGYVREHLRSLKAIFREFGGANADGEAYLLEARLNNGSRIIGVPANPRTARGYSASVLLDEFAHHEDAGEIWKAMFPIISAGHKLRVVSTPNGRGNKFYDLMEGEAGLWSRHRVDIYRAVADGLERDIAELRAGLDDPVAWAQEYELQWIGGGQAWLGLDLIESVTAPVKRYGGGACYVGLDLALRRDLWAAWILEQCGSRLETKEVAVLRGAGFPEQDAEVRRIFRQYRVAHLGVDQTGMGERVVSDYGRLFGSVVQGVTFTNAKKLSMAVGLRKMMEGGLITVPDDPDVRADLHSVCRCQGAGGLPIFDAVGGGNGHGDRFWALALAVAGWRWDVGEINYDQPKEAQNLQIWGDLADQGEDEMPGSTWI